MKPRTFTTLLVFLLFAVASVHAESVATLRMSPNELLPGLPTSFLLTVTNPDPRDARFLNSVQLEIQPADGDAFVAEWGRGIAGTGFPRELVDANQEIVVASGETRELYVPMDQTIVEPAFFWDARLNVPGRYQVRIRLFRSTSDGQSVWILSNWEALDITTPSGADADVYAAMTAVPGHWTVEHWADEGFEIASQIAEQYPESGYFPYALLLGQGSDELLERIETALARNPPGSVADYLRFKSATIHDRRSKAAFIEGRLDVAVSEATTARKLLDTIIDDTPYSFVRTQAAAYRAHAQDPKNLRGLYRWQNENAPSAPGGVVPFVQCVDRVAGVTVARFGYDNPNATAKRIAQGPDNRLFPGGADQGQPGYFAPGRRSNAAGVLGTTGQVAAWRLDGVEAVAAEESPLCGADEHQPVRPLLECVRADNQGVVASFGCENPNPFPVVVRFGDKNRFDVQGDLGQPQIFLPGRVRAAFKIHVKSGAPTWTLDARSVTASRGGSPICPK